MPVIVKAKKSDSTNDVIRMFKRATAAAGVVDMAKDRRYHVKPAEQRKIMKSAKRRLKKKIRSLKKMKNVGQDVIDRLTDRLNG